jgi:hypothetical protein
MHQQPLGTAEHAENDVSSRRSGSQKEALLDRANGRLVHDPGWNQRSGCPMNPGVAIGMPCVSRGEPSKVVLLPDIADGPDACPAIGQVTRGPGHAVLGRFDSTLHARAWLSDFFAWHNDEHHHAGLALFTPADVFDGRVAAVAATRQAALDGAYRAHPERFPNGPPRVRLPPAVVDINPIVVEVVDVTEQPATPLCGLVSPPPPSSGRDAVAP